MKQIIFFIIILLCYCSRKEESKVNVIDLLTPVTDKLTNLSDIATVVDYIPLQTIDSSLLSRINTVKVRGNYLYISTFEEVFCYNKVGRYLFKLNKKGRGPEEYILMKDFDIDHKSTLLAVLSISQILLFRQTENGFIFQNRILLLGSPSKISFTGNSSNILLQYSNEDGTKPFAMEIINLNGKSLLTWPNYMKYTSKDGVVVKTIYENISFSFDNNLYLKELQNDTLFRLTKNNTLESFLVFNTNRNRVTPEARANGNYYSDHIYEYIRISKIFGSERYIYYSYSFNKINSNVIHDQISKKNYKVLDKEFLEDDISGGVNFEPKSCSEGLLFSWVDALTLKKHIEGEIFINSIVKYPEKKEALKELADSLNETDNPVLIVVTPKK